MDVLRRVDVQIPPALQAFEHLLELDSRGIEAADVILRVANAAAVFRSAVAVGILGRTLTFRRARVNIAFA